MADGGKIQSIDRAILIMKLFSDDDRELKLQEICDRLDLNKSTAHGILSTLKYHGFIDQNEDNQKYHLGLKLLELSSHVLKRLDIREVSTPVLRKVCSAVGETAYLGILDGYDVVYIDKRESNQSMRLSATIGTRQYAYTSAIGRAILSFLQDEEKMKHLPAVFAEHTQYTIRNMEELRKELEETKRKGYAVVNEEYLDGLRSVGAPIFDYENNVVGAISIAGPTGRLTKERLPEVAEIICDAAQKISKDLGCRMLKG